MKHPFRTLALAFTAFVMALSTSCSAFSRRDAQDVGFMVAKSSLDLALAKVSGEKINLNEAGQTLAFQVISAVKDAAAFNLQAQGDPLAASVVSAAGDAAKLLIEGAALNDPRTRAVAQQLANEAIEIALHRLNQPPSLTIAANG